MSMDGASRQSFTKVDAFSYILFQADFVLHHLRGVRNVRADALFRQADHDAGQRNLSPLVHKCDNV